MFQIIDITNWQHEHIFVSGSKEKRWYRSESNKLHLFKLPISLTSNTWKYTDESTGEMWAEKVASEIGKVLNFEVHDVELGYTKATQEIVSYYGLDTSKIQSNLIYGALCVSFLGENESLIEGADMIMDFDDTYDRQNLKGQNEVYSYYLLEKVFSKFDFLEKLFQMIIFDALIGNTDRHQDNFGIIHNEKDNNIHFAPFYDNSSSLGRELPKHKVESMLKDQRMFNAYIFGKKSSSLIKWGSLESYEKLNHFEFMRKVINFNSDIMIHINNVSLLTDDKIRSILSFIPELIMHNSQKELVFKIIQARRNFILEEFKV